MILSIACVSEREFWGLWKWPVRSVCRIFFEIIMPFYISAYGFLLYSTFVWCSSKSCAYPLPPFRRLMSVSQLTLFQTSSRRRRGWRGCGGDSWLPGEQPEQVRRGTLIGWFIIAGLIYILYVTCLKEMRGRALYEDRHVLSIWFTSRHMHTLSYVVSRTFTAPLDRLKIFFQVCTHALS